MVVVLTPQSLDFPFELRPYAVNLCLIVECFANPLIALNWSEETIKRVHNYGGKAFTFFGDKDFAKPFYLPSRCRRNIFEVAGEVLRSQYVRMEAFYGVLGSVKDDEDIPRVRGLTLDYLRKIRRNILNFRRRHGRYPERFTEFNPPELKNPYMPYTADSGCQMLSLTYDEAKELFKVNIKLPVTAEPKKKGDWKWFSFTVKPTERLKELLKNGAKLLKPRLKLIRVKSGILKPVLEVCVKVKSIRKSRSRKLLPVDLGVRKVATLVLMSEKGEQLTKPTFIKSRILGKILKLKSKAENLEAKLSKLPKNSKRYKHLYGEFKRCWNKIRHLNYQVKHHASSLIVKFAKILKAGTIVFEDLSDYEVKNRSGKLSWLISTGFLRTIIAYTKYKAERAGIRVETVDAYNTSIHCPRCGSEGYHIIVPQLKNKPYKKGSYFYCPTCGYTADRDYVGALNIGLAYLNGGKLPEKEEGGVYKTTPETLAGVPSGQKLQKDKNPIIKITPQKDTKDTEKMGRFPFLR